MPHYAVPEVIVKAIDDVAAQVAPLSSNVAGLFADKGDAQHIGRAGRAERHAGDDDHPLAGLGEAFLEGDAAGAVHHVVEIVRVFGDDAMHAPDQRQFAAGLQTFGDSATIGGFGRSRATRKPVEPERSSR